MIHIPRFNEVESILLRHENATVTNLNHKVSLVRFQKIFLFWVAAMILETLDARLERTHSFVINPLKKHCHVLRGMIILRL